MGVRFRDILKKSFCACFFVSASLTELDVRYNDRMDGEAEAALREAVKLKGRGGFSLSELSV